MITAQAVKARYLGEDDDNRSIMDIIDYHNGDMEGKLKWGTQKNYFTTQRYISKFLQKSYKATDKYLQELDYNFIIKFKKYLRNDIPEDHQKPMGNNTVIKHIELFRKLINLSHKLGWIERDPCINFKSKFTKKERGFLSLDELQEIENKRLAIVRLHLKYIKIVI